MPFFGELLLAFAIAVILTGIFAGGFRRTGPWGSVLLFFFIVLLVTWAGGIWLVPAGPPLYGVYWIPFLFIGVFIALLLAAAGPTYEPRAPREDHRDVGDVGGKEPKGKPTEIRPEVPERPENELGRTHVGAAVGWFFWILLLGLIALIVIHYFVVWAR